MMADISHKKKNTLVKCLLFSVIIIVLDQITKNLAIKFLSDGDPVNVIGSVFQFVYIQNQGAAFGIMQGKQILFTIITIVVFILIIYVLIKMPDSDKYLPLAYSLTAIFGGALGNFIDRISNGYVVDFIYFTPIDFPVFNVADIFVTVGSIVLFILIIFVYKDEDFSFIKNNDSDR